MTKKIEGVPESFTREQYLSLFEAVGLSPDNVLNMTFNVDGVRAVVFEREPDGRKVATANGYAKHTIFIPVVDQEISK